MLRYITFMAGAQVWGVSVMGGRYLTFMAGAQVWGVSVMGGRYRTGGVGGFNNVDGR